MDWVGWILGYLGLWPPSPARSPLRRPQVLSVVVGPAAVAVGPKEQLLRSRHREFRLGRWYVSCGRPLRQRRFCPGDPIMTGHVIVLKQRLLNRKRGWTTTFLTPEGAWSQRDNYQEHCTRKKTVVVMTLQ